MTQSPSVAVLRAPISGAHIVVLNLPTPPSINQAFGNCADGRFVTRQYKAWREEAGYQINIQRPKRFTVPVVITITVKEPARPADIDNRIKGVLDLLVAHEVIPADDNRFVREVTARWGDVKGAVVEIRPCTDWVPRRGGDPT